MQRDYRKVVGHPTTLGAGGSDRTEGKHDVSREDPGDLLGSAEDLLRGLVASLDRIPISRRNNVVVDSDAIDGRNEALTPANRRVNISRAADMGNACVPQLNQMRCRKVGSCHVVNNDATFDPADASVDDDDWCMTRREGPHPRVFDQTRSDQQPVESPFFEQPRERQIDTLSVEWATDRERVAGIFGARLGSLEDLRIDRVANIRKNEPIVHVRRRRNPRAWMFGW